TGTGGAGAVRTPPHLPPGSDRIFEALNGVDPRGEHDLIVNLQGDLPALDPAYVRIVADALVNAKADVATLATEIDDPADRTNPNVPKPVIAWNAGGATGRALYFTRATAPHGEGPL